MTFDDFDVRSIIHRTKIYQTPIENLSKIYRKSIEHLSIIYRTSIEHLSKIYRTSIEHLSKIYRKSIEHLSNIYRTSIEHLSNLCRSSTQHPPKIHRTPTKCLPNIYRKYLPNMYLNMYLASKGWVRPGIVIFRRVHTPTKGVPASSKSAFLRRGYPPLQSHPRIWGHSGRG